MLQCDDPNMSFGIDQRICIFVKNIIPFHFRPPQAPITFTELSHFLVGCISVFFYFAKSAQKRPFHDGRGFRIKTAEGTSFALLHNTDIWGKLATGNPLSLKWSNCSLSLSNSNSSLLHAVL